MRMAISKWTEDSTKELVEQLLQDGKLIGAQEEVQAYHRKAK
jgi:hypothetical protein